MVSLQKTRAVAPVHLMSEEASQAQMAAIEVKQPPMLPAVQTAATPKKAASVTEAGVMMRINQKEKAQEKLDAFLMQSEVFALKQDLRFKHEKKDVMIEQGVRLKIFCAELSDNGKSVKLDLCSVTKDDWDNISYYFGEHKFCYSHLRFNIDSLEKYFEPDYEIKRLMTRRNVFKYLGGTSIGVSLILGLIIILLCLFRRPPEYALMFTSSVIGCGVFGVLSVLWGVLCMRTRGAVYKRLQSAENQILQQRTLMQHKDEGNNE